MNSNSSSKIQQRERARQQFLDVILESTFAQPDVLYVAELFPLTIMHYNFESLRSIPIVDVAHALKIELVKTGSGIYAMKENGEITSLIIFERTNNFHRFSGKEQGGVSRGSSIDLVMHIQGCSLHAAVEFLTSYFPRYL
jgi:hypothetical protein